MPDWTNIRRHYADAMSLIESAPINEWALDPYAWEGKHLLRMTPIEDALWADLRAEDVVMYPQYPVAGVFVDFANPKAKVAIECDGHAYHLDKAKDAARDEKLVRLGWTVYRLTGRECKTDFDDETRTHGDARKLVREICKAHPVSKTFGVRLHGNA